MIPFIRFLLLLFVLELGFCGYLVAKRLARPLPVLPAAESVDPLTMSDFQELARQAETGSSQEWVRLGQALLGQGFYSYAENCFLQATQFDPADAVAQASYAFCLERTGRMQASTMEYEKLKSFKGQISIPLAQRERYLYAIGRNYLREENAAKAEEIFRQNAGFQPADYQLAKLLVRSGRSNDALPIIDRNLIETPDSLFFNLLKVQALETLGRTAEAKQAADRVERAMHIIPLNFNTGFTEPYHSRYGISKEIVAYDQLLQGNDMDQIADKLEEVLQLMGDRPMPEHTASMISMVEVEYQRKNPERMLTLIEKLKESGVENAELLQFQAGAYTLMGETEQAVPLLLRAAQMSPTIEVHQTLANYYDQRQETEKRDTHQAKSQLLNAMHAFRNNQLAFADKAIQQSVKRNPLDPQAWFYYAKIKHLQGELNAARKAYERCVELNPNHGRALRELSDLTVPKKQRE
tara:strand:- start:3374 stop:4771 length:1398 start_codon:yes stop_codon:yes gene_type:complete